ncbi:MAG: hypothetical protein ABIQ18_04430 [Umezawaea sp.]
MTDCGTFDPRHRRWRELLSGVVDKYDLGANELDCEPLIPLAERRDTHSMC